MIAHLCNEIAKGRKGKTVHMKQSHQLRKCNKGGSLKELSLSMTCTNTTAAKCTNLLSLEHSQTYDKFVDSALRGLNAHA